MGWQKSDDIEINYHLINESQILELPTVKIKKGMLTEVLYNGRMYKVEKSFDPESYFIRDLTSRKIVYFEVGVDETGIVKVTYELRNSIGEIEGYTLYDKYEMESVRGDIREQ